MTLDDVKKLDVKEIKALAYDQLAILEQTQKNLQILNQVIAEKSKPAEPVKE
jgi:hypothetical protein